MHTCFISYIKVSIAAGGHIAVVAVIAISLARTYVISISADKCLETNYVGSNASYRMVHRQRN